MDHPDRKPRCTAGLRQRRVSTALPAGELMCLPLRSILPLHPSFFPERGRSSFSGGALDDGDSARFLEIVLNYGNLPFPSLFLPQPPLTRAVSQPLAGTIR